MQPEKPCFAAGLADNDDDTPGQTGVTRSHSGEQRGPGTVEEETWDQLLQRSSANEN